MGCESTKTVAATEGRNSGKSRRAFAGSPGRDSDWQPGNSLLLFCPPVNGIPTPGYSISQLLEVVERACRDYTSEFTWTLLIAAASASCILVFALLLSWLTKSVVWQLVFVLTLAMSCAKLRSADGQLDCETVWLDGSVVFYLALRSHYFCTGHGKRLVLLAPGTADHLVRFSQDR